MLKIFSKKFKVSLVIIIFLCVLIGFFGVFNIDTSMAADPVVTGEPTHHLGEVGTGLWNMVTNPIDSIVFLVVGAFVNIIVAILGAILNIVIWAVIHIAKYNNFINEDSIIQAWAIIRDLCNMFFVLILLVIAFATILRIESYNAKKMLPKLLLMAVLINFSRTICGFIIDAGQIVMLTFMSAIGDSGGNYITHLGVEKYLSTRFSEMWKGELTLTSTLIGLMLSVIFMIIATIVMVVLLCTLVMRIVMLWIYIVLSPLAFLMSSFPAGQKYASQWWGDFIKQVVSGPVLAFFLWLSLISVNTIKSVGSGGTGKGGCFGPSEILCPDNFVMFVVGIGMLVGGLMVAQQAGGAAASIAGKGLGIATATGKMATKPFTAIGRGMGAVPDYLNRKVAGGFKVPFSDKRFKGTRVDLSPGRFVQRIKTGFEEGKREDISMMQARAGDVMKKGGVRGLLAGLASDDAAKEILTGPLGMSGVYNILTGGQGKVEKARAQSELTKLFLDRKKEQADGTWNNEKETKFEANKKDIIKDMSTIKGGRFGRKGKEFGTKAAEKYEKKIDDMAKETNAEKLLTKEYTKRSDQTLKKMIPTLAGDKAFLSSVNEAKSKYQTTDEDDVVEKFKIAAQKGHKEDAAALFLKASEVGGLNTLLEKSGYSWVDAGFTKKEAEELKSTKEGREIYESKKGVNDFVRDVLVDQLQMDEQKAFTIQGEAATTNFQNGHLYGAKTISIKNGQRVQNTVKDQREAIVTDARKGDIEAFGRKQQQSGVGGKDAKGNFVLSDTGQEVVLRSWKVLLTEIGKNRWNQSQANVVGQKEEIEKLEKIVAKVGKEEFGTVKDKNGNKLYIDEFFKQAQEYAKRTGDDMGKKINDALEGAED